MSKLERTRTEGGTSRGNVGNEMERSQHKRTVPANLAAFRSSATWHFRDRRPATRPVPCQLPHRFPIDRHASPQKRLVGSGVVEESNRCSAPRDCTYSLSNGVGPVKGVARSVFLASFLLTTRIGGLRPGPRQPDACRRRRSLDAVIRTPGGSGAGRRWTSPDSDQGGRPYGRISTQDRCPVRPVFGTPHQ